MPFAEALRQQHLHGLTQKLGAGIAEYLFGLRIDQSDPALAVNHDDCIWCRFQQAAKLFLCPFTSGDISNCSSHQHALLSDQWTEADLYGEFTAISSQPKKFKTGTHRSHLRPGKVCGAMIGVLVSKSFRDEDFQLFSQNLAALISEEMFRL